MATIYYTDGRIEPLDLAAGDTVLHQLQAIVGGYIEVVYLDGHADMLVLDEDGKRKDRPPNAEATQLARDAGRLHPSDVIVGDVVRCAVDSPGEDTERWY